MKARLLGAASACVLVLITTTTNAVAMPLEIRFGGLAYYDPNLGISWLADANAFEGSIANPDGLVDWFTARNWVDNLIVAGVTNWRLPSSDVDGDGVRAVCSTLGSACTTDNEMGYLLEVEGITSDTPGPFTNIEFSNKYWTSTEKTEETIWLFNMTVGGAQTSDFKSTDGYFVWAVHDGDVGALVPVPAAAWLFISGLLGLIGISRKKRAA